MKLSDFLNMPKNLNIEEYEILLNKKNKLAKKLYNLSIKIEDEKDSIEILKNEQQSVRYNKHLDLLNKYNKQFIKVKKEYDEILKRKLH